MGMCAIYTAVAPPSEPEIAALARSNEARIYGSQRRTLGRKAVAELALLYAPETHQALARAVLDRDLWALLTPAAARGNHAVAIRQVHRDLVIPTPLWPSSTEWACLVGSPPARYVGNNLMMLPADLVREAVTAFEKREHENEIVAYLNEFLREARDRSDAILLHWDYR